MSAKREQNATKSTPPGHASDGAVAFHIGAGELKLEPCVPSGIVRRNDDIGVQNAAASVHAHANRNHCGFVCTSESHGKAVCVRFPVRAAAAEKRCANGKLQPTTPCPDVSGFKESQRTSPPLLTLPTVLFVRAPLSSLGFIFSEQNCLTYFL